MANATDTILKQIQTSMAGIHGSTNSFRQAANAHNTNLQKIVKDIYSVFSENRSHNQKTLGVMDKNVTTLNSQGLALSRINQTLQRSISIQQSILSQMTQLNRNFGVLSGCSSGGMFGGSTFGSLFGNRRGGWAGGAGRFMSRLSNANYSPAVQMMKMLARPAGEALGIVGSLGAAAASKYFGTDEDKQKQLTPPGAPPQPGGISLSELPTPEEGSRPGQVQANRNSNTGAHPNTVQKNLVQVNTAVGRATLHKDIAAQAMGFIAALKAAGFPFSSINSHAVRPNRFNPSKWSEHSYGNAIDIDNTVGWNDKQKEWIKKYPGRLEEIAKQFGGRFTVGAKDPNHIEFDPRGMTSSGVQAINKQKEEEAKAKAEAHQGQKRAGGGTTPPTRGAPADGGAAVPAPNALGGGADASAGGAPAQQEGGTNSINPQTRGSLVDKPPQADGPDRQRYASLTPPDQSSSDFNVSNVPRDDIISLGKYLQGLGLRVSEHPQFGGVSKGVHKGKGHKEARALDVNVGTGMVEAKNKVWGQKFDTLAESLRNAGYKVVWRKDGHYNHMHVESPRGGTRNNQNPNQQTPSDGQPQRREVASPSQMFASYDQPQAEPQQQIKQIEPQPNTGESLTKQAISEQTSQTQGQPTQQPQSQPMIIPQSVPNSGGMTPNDHKDIFNAIAWSTEFAGQPSRIAKNLHQTYPLWDNVG